MDDFRRKSAPRPSQPVQPPAPEPVIETPIVTSPLPIETDAQPSVSAKPKKSWKKRVLWTAVSLVSAAILAVGGATLWYTSQLMAVDASKTDRELVIIESGSTPKDIAALLKNESLIRDERAFLLYLQFNNVEGSLQAGTYRLSPAESTPQIVSHLVKGTVDTISLTFLPGATLDDNRKVFLAAGYSEEEVAAAFAKSYESPLFNGRPASADLEGYIYGETYSFGTNTSVEAILEYIFEHFNGVVEENDLIAQYQARGLSLYEGITLASIVQREASPKGDDMPQIAQVFYSRLSLGMPLGSDVTYQYIADKTGVARDPGLDSPYNTRRYTGLPPGPIAAPGEKALLAVAQPAAGDYLYFLSGDDDITYYGRTLDDHEANIVNHCQTKCQIL